MVGILLLGSLPTVVVAALIFNIASNSMYLALLEDI